MRLLLTLVLFSGCGRSLERLKALERDCTDGVAQACQCRSGTASTRTCGAGGRLEACACDALQVAPAQLVVSTAKTVQLKAFFEKDTGSSVTWTVQHGSIAADGTYTAPPMPGDDTITVVSQDDATLRATVPVRIVELPKRPKILVAQSVLASTADVAATLDSPNPDWTYTWTIFGAQFNSVPSGPSIKFVAETVGLVALGVVATNAAGDAGPPAQVFVTAVPPLEGNVLPAIAVPETATAGREHITARVIAPVTGLHYEWTNDNGDAVAIGDGSTADVRAGLIGPMTLSVTGVDAAGSRTETVSTTVSVVAGGTLTALVGTLGGPGHATGADVDARMLTVRGFGTASDGLLFVDAESFGFTTQDRIVKLLADGSVVGVLGPTNIEFNAATEHGGKIFAIAGADPSGNCSDYAFVRMTSLAIEQTWCLQPGSRYKHVAFVGEDAYLLTDRALTKIDTTVPPGGGDGDDDYVLGSSTTGCTGTIGTSALLQNVVGMTEPVGGHVYIAQKERVIDVDMADFSFSTVMGSCTDSPFIESIAVDASQRLYYASNNAIYGKETAPSGPAKLLAGGVAGIKDGTGTTAQFDGDLELHMMGNVLIVGQTASNDDAGFVRELTSIDLSLPAPAQATLVRTPHLPANPDRNAVKCVDSTIVSPFYPTALAEAPDGGIVFSDNGNCRVIKRERNGSFRAIAGSGFDESVSGFALQAGLSSEMTALQFQPDGALIVAERYGTNPYYNYLRKLTEFGYLSIYAGAETAAMNVTSDGRGANAQLVGPRSLAYEPTSGLMLFADQTYSNGSRSQLRALQQDGEVITIFGDSATFDDYLYDEFRSVTPAGANSVFLAHANTSNDLDDFVISKVSFGPAGATASVVASSHINPAFPPLPDSSAYPGPYGVGSCFELVMPNSGYSAKLAYDAFDDTLYLADSWMIWRLRNVSTPSACVADILAGDPQRQGVKTGPLPASLNWIGDMKLNSARDLIITDRAEDAILILRP